MRSILDVFSAFRGKEVGPAISVKVEPYPCVSNYHWTPENGSRNFGDHLNIVVCGAMARKFGYTFEDEVSISRRLLAIGSVMHYAEDGDVIWGTGVNGKVPLEYIRARRLDIRAVRGPKTRNILVDMGMTVPKVFGDPALLVPSLFENRFTVKAMQDYIVIPNLHDLPLVSDTERLVSPLWGWNRVVERIASAKFVVASSLHGIILAEAMGVPARYTRLSETESRFKYDDYAQGTGRDELIPAFSIEEALTLGAHPPMECDIEELKRAFPIDLWAKN